MKRTFVCIAITLCVMTLRLAPVLAKEPYAEFVQGLRDNGYGELAVHYLEQAKAAGQLPEELAQVFELEMGLSKVVWAAEGVNAEQANARLDQAQAHFQAFLKAAPQDESAPVAVDSLGSMLSDRGQFEIRQAQATKDKQRQARHFEDARKYFAQAREWMKQTLDRTQTEFTELSKKAKDATAAQQAKTGTKRPTPVRRLPSRRPTEDENELQQAETAWLDARLNYAVLDYYEALTYADAAAKPRKDLLASGAKKFDDIYQGYRTNIVGVLAHMWHGRCLDEAGDIRGALDIYEEVLPAEDVVADNPFLEELFAQVEMYRLLLLRKQKKNEEFGREAADWIKKHASMKKLPGYQGIALELLKYQIEQSKDLKGKERETVFRAILKQLAEMTRVRSEYQQEAFLLRRQYQSEVKGEEVEIASFDEGVAVANDAVETGRWADAVSAFTKSIALADQTKDADRIRRIQLQLAYAQLMSGKPEDAILTSQAIVKQNANDAIAPQAGAMSVQAALQIYAAAKDKSAPFLQLTQLAEATIKQWPTRPEADDARIALAQAANVVGDSAKALAAFESVNPQSERFPVALFYAGQIYWRNYLVQKQKPPAQRDEKVLSEQRAKAEDALTRSLAGQEKQLRAGDPPPRQMIEARLFLGEMALEANKADQAQRFLDPLAETLVNLNPPGLDNLSVRQLVGALRARNTQAKPEDLAKSGDIASLLLKSPGTDDPYVNVPLIEYVKLLEQEYRKAQGNVLATEKDENESKRAAAETQRDEALAKFKQWILQSAERKKLTLAGSIYVAESLVALDQNAKAREQFELIDQRAKNEAGFLPQTGGSAAMIRVRSQLIGLLRSEEKYDEALQQADQLVKDTQGRALEPLMEKARIVQAIAEKAPATLQRAVDEWSTLRNRMSKLQKKPPEYYEATFNLAHCLLQKAEQATPKDKQSALQAEQLMKATLALSPNLSGPVMVARYKDRLEDAAAIRTGIPRPKPQPKVESGSGSGSETGSETPAAPNTPPAADANAPAKK